MNAIPIKQVAVLGAGSWGTALAILLERNGLQVRLWGHDEIHIQQLRDDRENKAFLPGIALKSSIDPVSDIAYALQGSDEILIVVPSHAFRTVLNTIIQLIPKHAGISWATKGFDPNSNLLLHQTATEVLGPQHSLAVVSGPTFAQEVARGLPTAVTVASWDRAYAQRVASYLHSGYFRAYTSDDLIGVQVGGAAKNVLAIAAGIADGLGFGANTRAALITRGLAELARLGIALKGKPNTFMGLAGLGDLALTCTDNQSRNRRLGLCLAKGLSVEQACREIGQEVEGVGTTKSIFRKSLELGVEMPICEQVYRVIYDNVNPSSAAQTLLDRSTREETD